MKLAENERKALGRCKAGRCIRLSEVLEGILDYEDKADAQDEAEASGATE